MLEGPAIIEKDVLDNIQHMAAELDIECANPAPMAAIAQQLSQFTIGDVTVLACYLLAAAKTASEAGDA